MRGISLTIAALALLAMGSVARAQGSGFHEHDGFFVQMNLGAGPIGSSASRGGFDFELSGTGGAFSLAIGAAVVPNLIVAGHFWGQGTDSPTVKVNGQSRGTPSQSGLSLTCFGANVTYYFMPIGIYVSATPSLGMLFAQAAAQNYGTKNGFALRLAVGKEWWVSHQWGIGLNLQYAHSSNDGDGVTPATSNPPTWKTNAFALVLSATYN